MENFFENLLSNGELQEEIAELKAKNFELKESLKCFQTPEAIKALTFYKTGEFELQEKKCIELEQENARLKAEKTELEEKFLTLNGKSYSYLMTLQEIKEIIENNCWDYTDVTVLAVKDKILQKITKAEEE